MIAADGRDHSFTGDMLSFVSCGFGREGLKISHFMQRNLPSLVAANKSSSSLDTIIGKAAQRLSSELLPQDADTLQA